MSSTLAGLFNQGKAQLAAGSWMPARDAYLRFLHASEAQAEPLQGALQQAHLQAHLDLLRCAEELGDLEAGLRHGQEALDLLLGPALVRLHEAVAVVDYAWGTPAAAQDVSDRMHLKFKGTSSKAGQLLATALELAMRVERLAMAALPREPVILLQWVALRRCFAQTELSDDMAWGMIRLVVLAYLRANQALPAYDVLLSAAHRYSRTPGASHALEKPGVPTKAQLAAFALVLAVGLGDDVRVARMTAAIAELESEPQEGLLLLAHAWLCRDPIAAAEALAQCEFRVERWASLLGSDRDPDWTDAVRRSHRQMRQTVAVSLLGANLETVER